MGNHLQEIIVGLADSRIKFIVCGGVAAVLQGVERMTVDIDIALEKSEENTRTFLQCMETLSLQPRAPVAAEVLLEPEKIAVLITEKNAFVFSFVDEQNPYRQLDVFLRDEFDYNALYKQADSIWIDGRSVLVLSKSQLIDLKTRTHPVRDKDLWDLKELRKLLEQEREL